MIEEIIDTMANIEYGILLAVIIVAILMFMLNAMNGNKSFSALSYIIGIVIVCLLSFQLSRLIGAMDIANAERSIARYVNMVSPTLENSILSAEKKEISWFIFRRIIWSVLFLGIGSYAIYATMELSAKNPRKKSRSYKRGSRRSYDNEF